MILMAVVAAGGGLSIPSPNSTFKISDYPEWAVRQSASAGSVLHLAVDPDGKPIGCTNKVLVGNEDLAKEICRLISRKRLKPETLRDGQKVYAFFDTLITLLLPDTKEGRKIMGLRMNPDAQLLVSRLPEDNEAEVGILLAYDTSGKVTDCEPSATEKNIKLAGVACGQKALFDNSIQKDGSGQAVNYITQKRIKFTVQPPAK